MNQLKNRPIVVIVVLLLSLAAGAVWTITDRPTDIEIDPLLEPRIIGQLPRPGEEMPFDGAIDIYFNHPMNSTSVRLALSTRPYFRHELTWLDPQTLRLTPAEGTLRPDTTYTISLSTLARTQEGYALSEPISIEFKTIGELLVQEIAPGDGTENIDSDSVITVIFNRPVVPLTLAKNMAGLPNPIEFKPDIPGEGEWLNTNIYVWRPTEPMPGGQEYQATIPKGFEGLSGESLRRAYTWEFTTTLPIVEEIYIDDRSLTPEDDYVYKVAALESQVKVLFNQRMNRAKAEATFSLYQKSPRRAISGTFTWEEDDRLMIFTPDDWLEMDTLYQIEIDPKVKGEELLTQGATVDFRSVPYPAVAYTDPKNGERDAARYSSIPLRIEFNTAMNEESILAEGAIVIEPELESVEDIYTSKPWWWSWRETYAYVDGVMKPNTTYTVTISGDVEDIYGHKMGEPYTFSFTTAGYGEYIQVDSGDYFNFYDASRPTQIVLTTRNAHNLGFKLYRLIEDESAPWHPDALDEATLIRQWMVEPGGPPDELVTQPIDIAEDGGSLEPGMYKLTIDQTEEYNGYWHFLFVGNANLTLKASFDEALTWLTDLHTGEPIAGREVRVYGLAKSSGDFTELGSGITDEQGIVDLSTLTLQDMPSDWRGLYDQVVAVVDDRGTFAVSITSYLSSPRTGDFGVDYQYYNVSQSLYLFTDRPLYRPGQEVFFQGILRAEDDVTYSLPSEGTVMVKVVSRYNSDHSIYSDRLEVDEMGTFSGSFIIPEEASLSRYYFLIETGAEENRYRGSWHPNSYFDVADYRKPELTVELSSEQLEVIDGEDFEATVEGRYFFGEPLSDTEVIWTYWSVPYIFDYTGPGHYRFYDSTSYWYNPPATDDPDYERMGGGVTDKNGQFTISFPTEIEEGYQSQRYIVEATAESITGQVDVIVHQAEYYVGIRAKRYAVSSGEALDYDLVVVDWDSQPIPNQTITVQPYKQDWHWEQIVINDYGYDETVWGWVVEETAIGDPITVTTDQDGQAVVSFTPDAAGSYRIRASINDPEGREHAASTFSWVRRPGYVSWRPAEHNDRIDVIADQERYQPGDTAELLITSPYQGEVQALITVERGSILSYELITIDGGSYLYELPITGSYAPNIYVSVIIINGIDEETPIPDFKMGLVELKVDTVEQELQVAIIPDRERVAPGEDVTYRIEVTDQTGAAVQDANVTLSLVDLALLSLTEPNADPILEHFYSDRPLGVITAVPLAGLVDRLLIELVEPEGGGAGGGGGPPSPGVVTEDMLRSEFEDTAYWTTQLITDQNGVAEVTITLPDNLTTWRMEARAFTVDAHVGQATNDVVSTIPLLIRPQTPRFFIAKDKPVLAAIVHNNTDEDMEVFATLGANGVTFEGPLTHSITIPAHGHVQVEWPVTVDEDVEWVDLVFSAQGTTTSGENYADAVKPEIGDPRHDRMLPVYRYDVQETVGLAGQLTDPGERIEGLFLPPTMDYGEGELTIQLDSTLATSLFGALTWLENYPYECNEQVASRLLANATTLRLLRESGIDKPELEAHLEEEIAFGIDLLLESYKNGWGWWPGDDQNPMATAYVYHSLAVAEEAGFEWFDVGAGYGRGYNYLRAETRNFSILEESYELNRRVYILYVLAMTDNYDLDDGAEDIDKLYEARHKLSIYAKALLAQTIWMESRYDPRLETLKTELISEAAMSATGIHWEEDEWDYWNWNTDLRTSAIVLDTFALIWPESNLNPQTVRYLMTAREADHWTTTQETVWSLAALTDWMLASDEFDADYEWSVGLNGEPLGSGDTITDDPVILTAGMDDLPVGELNTLIFGRTEGPGSLYYTTHLTLDLPVEEVQALSRGVMVSRRYLDADGNPVTQAHVGDELTVEVTVVATNDMHFFVLEDYYPAGADAVNTDLLVESELRPRPLLTRIDELRRWGWGWWYFSHIELRDEKAVLSTDYLPAGTYQFTYQIRLSVAGEYHVIPTTAWEFYFPEVYGRGDGMLFTVLPRQ